MSIGLWQEIGDWSKFSRGRGLENEVELLTCKCSFSTLGNMGELINNANPILKPYNKKVN